MDRSLSRDSPVGAASGETEADVVPHPQGVSQRSPRFLSADRGQFMLCYPEPWKLLADFRQG
jgi:hypothetical protein